MLCLSLLLFPPLFTIPMYIYIYLYIIYIYYSKIVEPVISENISSFQ